MDKTQITLDELFSIEPEPETKNNLFKKIEVNGYKAKFHNDYVEFGCVKIYAELFTDLVEAIAHYYKNLWKEK